MYFPLSPVLSLLKFSMSDVLIVEQVTTKYLNGLIELIHSNLQTNQESATIETPKRHFQRTIDLIASREYDGVVTTVQR